MPEEVTPRRSVAEEPEAAKAESRITKTKQITRPSRAGMDGRKKQQEGEKVEIVAFVVFGFLVGNLLGKALDHFWK